MWELNDPITWEEFQHAVKKLKNGKAAGLTDDFSVGTADHEQWHRSQCVPVPKKTYLVLVTKPKLVIQCALTSVELVLGDVTEEQHPREEEGRDHYVSDNGDAAPIRGGGGALSNTKSRDSALAMTLMLSPHKRRFDEDKRRMATSRSWRGREEVEVDTKEGVCMGRR
jgi:hypothetical protein